MTMPEFRAWDKERNEIVDVMSIDFSNKKVGVCNIPKRMFDGRLHTIYSIEKNWDEIELMQSTGLKDSKGLEIFEGDIIKHTDKLLNITTINKVYWKGGSLIFDVVIDEGLAHDISLYKITKNNDQGYDDELEVLGNIYESPELLEVAEW